jgi:predicted nucleic acid-binding protein
MIVLDTTVLVYATGTEHRFRDPSRELIQAAMDRRLQATTTVEAIQEFTHVRARRRGRTDAVALADSFVRLLSPLLTVSAEDLARGLRLFERSDRLGAFDSVLAAAAARAGARALVSADSAFGELTDVVHVVPDAGGVGDLLGHAPP